MVKNDDCDKKDIINVIDNYLKFTEEKYDTQVLVCKWDKIE